MTSPEEIILEKKIDYVRDQKAKFRRNPILLNFAQDIAKETGYSLGTVLANLAKTSRTPSVIEAMYQRMISLTGDTQIQEKFRTYQFCLNTLPYVHQFQELLEVMASDAERLLNILRLLDDSWPRIEKLLQQTSDPVVQELVKGYDGIEKPSLTEEEKKLLAIFAQQH